MSHWSEKHMLVPAVYIIVRNDTKILLLRRANTGFCDGDYSLPSGHVERGESPSVAAARELAEEVGVVAQPSDLIMAHCMFYEATEKDHDRVSVFFTIDIDDMDTPYNAEPDKCDQLMWCEIDDLPSKTIWELRHAFKHIAAGDVYSEANY